MVESCVDKIWSFSETAGIAFSIAILWGSSCVSEQLASHTRLAKAKKSSEWKIEDWKIGWSRNSAIKKGAS